MNYARVLKKYRRINAIFSKKSRGIMVLKLKKQEEYDTRQVTR